MQAGMLTWIVLNLQLNLWSITILAILFSCPQTWDILSFTNASFKIFQQCCIVLTSFVKFVPSYFIIFDDFINGIIYSCLHCSWLVYTDKIDFYLSCLQSCQTHLLVTVLFQRISWNSLYLSSMCKISFISLPCLISLAGTNSTVCIELVQMDILVLFLIMGKSIWSFLHHGLQSDVSCGCFD